MSLLLQVLQNPPPSSNGFQIFPSARIHKSIVVSERKDTMQLNFSVTYTVHYVYTFSFCLGIEILIHCGWQHKSGIEIGAL